MYTMNEFLKLKTTVLPTLSISIDLIRDYFPYNFGLYYKFLFLFFLRKFTLLIYFQTL